MNPAKAKYKVGKAPKEQTVTITEAGSDFNVTVAGTAADGSKISVSYTIPSSGGPGKIVESSSYDGISAKRMGPNERVMSYMKGGKTIYTAHSKVSTDGNTMSVAAKGVNSLGQTVDANIAYDKEK